MENNVKLLDSWIRSCLSYPQDQFFDQLMNKINDHCEVIKQGSVRTFAEVKSNKNKLKGDLFEIMCFRLLRDGSLGIKCKNIWLFKDLPQDLRTYLSFSNKDVGIDIIIETISEEWIAVQCKYRKKPNKSFRQTDNGPKRISWQVNWKDLSTFYSLCERTGPHSTNSQEEPSKSGWKTYLVMTTAESVNRQGRKGPKDKSICIGSFKGLSKEAWFKFIGDTGNTLDKEKDTLDKEKDTLTLNELRLKRLALFDKK